MYRFDFRRRSRARVMFAQHDVRLKTQTTDYITEKKKI